MAWKQYPSAEKRGDENGNVEELIGDVWTRVITGGARKVVLSSTDDLLTGSTTLAASSATLLITGFSGYKTLVFTISGVPADSFEIKFGYDTDSPPTLQSEAVKMLDLTVNTETLKYVMATAIGETNTYEVNNIAAVSVYFARTGTADTPTITYAARKS